MTRENKAILPAKALMQIRGNMEESLLEVEKQLGYLQYKQEKWLSSLQPLKAGSLPGQAQKEWEESTQMQEERQKLEMKKQALLCLRVYIDDLLDTLSPLQQQILRSRYIQKQSWVKTSLELHISERHAQRLMNTAFLRLSGLMGEKACRDFVREKEE